MQGKILIVDTIATNRIVIKVKLKKAYYEVIQAASLKDAMAQIEMHAPDLIIAATDLPDGGAATLCHKLKSLPHAESTPVLATSTDTDPETRLQTLKAGAHDVLCQPVNETLLLGRVRSLIRAHNATAEWQMREDTCHALGLAEDPVEFADQGHCVVVGSDHQDLRELATALRPTLRSMITLAELKSLMLHVSLSNVPDLFVILLAADRETAMMELAAVSTLRANAMTRHAGVIVIQRCEDTGVGTTALDLGADDLMIGGLDIAELTLRARAVMRRKKLSEHLRATVRNGLQAAVFDPLTGVYNRRYAMPHLERVAKRAMTTDRQFAVLVLDLDHFKRINDVYGHASGDAVLSEVAKRLRSALRESDMVARIGGEEFMVVMPNTDAKKARHIALRICEDVSSTPFTVAEGAKPITVTISIGMAVGGDSEDDTKDGRGQAVLAQADRALYAAKGRGRNQVTSGRPAA